MSTSKLSTWNLYQQEKKTMSGPTEEFPSYKEWLADYNKDREEIGHVTVDSETAMKEADKLVEEAEQELSAEVNTQPEKKVEQKQETKTDKKSTEKEKKPSKKQLCVAIYKEMMEANNNQHPVRKEVMKRFQEEVNMTEAGSGTYWFNIKKELSQ